MKHDEPNLDALVDAMRDDTLSKAQVDAIAHRLGDLLPPVAVAPPEPIGGDAPPSPTPDVAKGAGLLGGAATKVVAVVALAIGGGVVVRAGLPDATPSAASGVTVTTTDAGSGVAPAIEPIASGPSPSAPPHPEPALSGESVPSAVPRTPSAPSLKKPVDAEVAEHQLLAEARAQLSGNPVRALALAEEHARRFPSGVLAPEREMIAIDALVARGDVDAARSRAERLARRWPQSYFVARLRARGLLP